MFTFLILATSITALTLFLLVKPLLAKEDADKESTKLTERKAQNIYFAKQRLLELEQQSKSGAFSDEKYQQLRLEIEQTLADDVDLQKAEQQHQQAASLKQSNRLKQSNKGLIIALSVLLPLMAFALYKIIGHPQAISAQNQPAAVQPANSVNDISPENVQEMIQQLEQRLQTEPDNIEGWTLLARTYISLGRYDDAIKANQHLLQIRGDNADTLSDIADASALANQGNLTGKPTEYLNRALQLNPDHPQSLWLSGVAALQLDKPDDARVYWNRLLPLIANSPEQQNELKDLIERTKMSPDELAKLRDNEQSKTKSQVESAPASLTISVKLDTSISNSVQSNDTVFVFAKAKQGSLAPLAVKRLTVADLPTTITLSDSDAMMPQLSISKFDELVISARISKSGNPIAQSGDIQSNSVATSNETSKKIVLILAQPVK